MRILTLNQRAETEEEDLGLPPLVMPPGYRRDSQGRWRYERGGMPVPGARDVTLASLWGGPPRGGRHKRLAIEYVRTCPELAWCLEVAGVEVSVEGRRPGWPGARRFVLVPVDEWARRARIPLGVSAPELMPDRLVDAAGVARLAGVDRKTIAAYRSRGLLPPAVYRVGGSPVWSLPVIVGWLEDRPGQGVGGGRVKRHKRRKAPAGRAVAARRRGPDLLRWADSMLDRLGADGDED